MDNVTTISILDRALKGRNRRDRAGKNRRPVTDGLIEYAKNLRDENDALISKIIERDNEIEALNAKILELERAAAKRDEEAEAIEAKMLELKNQILDLATSSESKKEDAPAE